MPNVWTDDLTERENENMRENHSFKISDLSIEFPDVSQATLFRIVADTLGYCKLHLR